MTVPYTHKIASQGFGSIFKVLLRWTGSVYKMVWQEVLVYLLLYYSISFIYRFALPETIMRWFERLVMHIAVFRNIIPVSFVLGFYVALVVDRWWGTYKSFPWPDTVAVLLATHLGGMDGRSKAQRSEIMRYVNLTIAITFSKVSPVVKKKFGCYQDFVDKEYMTEREKEIIERLDGNCGTHITYVPIMWACKVVDRARLEGNIRSNSAQKTVTDEILKVRGRCGSVMGWHDNNIPLVYTQVVTIAVYSFFFFSLIGEQYIDPKQGYNGYSIDLYFPVSGLLQLVFYMGWLKVAEALLNPFGDDDHDFELDALLVRHWRMSRLLSQPAEFDLPPLTRGDDADVAKDEFGSDELVPKMNSKLYPSVEIDL
ncbi:bestrophin-2-like isoform X1 [Penaeus chinensis]|uniref:bestrophin-2-like isoform X1 n=2 Tax=Penaeus chinensis TaxID=139456 RepID=UPI001FB6ABAE|nr:bestrophin-2-like isoform X1 [Penaeus chinensis]